MRGQWIGLTVIATVLVFIAAGCAPAGTPLPPPTVAAATDVPPTVAPPPPTTAPLPTVVPTAPPSPTAEPRPTVAPTAPPPPTAATAAGAFPTGIFTNSVGWTWEFTADGKDTFQGADVRAWGTYTVTGNQVVFKESSSNCGPGAQEGTYTWAYDGKALSFKVLDDRCGQREGSLTSGAWVKKP